VFSETTENLLLPTALTIPLENSRSRLSWLNQLHH